MRSRGAVRTFSLLCAIAVAAAPGFGQKKTSIPERPFGGSRSTRDWGHIRRETEGANWYRRYLVADLRSMRENVERLRKAVEAGGGRTRDVARASQRIADSARSARRNLRQGDDGGEKAPQAATDSETDTVAERVDEIEKLVAEVHDRVAKEVRAQQVDVQGRDETLSLLTKIESLAVTVRESAGDTSTP